MKSLTIYLMKKRFKLVTATAHVHTLRREWHKG